MLQEQHQRTRADDLSISVEAYKIALEEQINEKEKFIIQFARHLDNLTKKPTNNSRSKCPCNRFRLVCLFIRSSVREGTREIFHTLHTSRACNFDFWPTTQEVIRVTAIFKNVACVGIPRNGVRCLCFCKTTRVARLAVPFKGIDPGSGAWGGGVNWMPAWLASRLSAVPLVQRGIFGQTKVLCPVLNRASSLVRNHPREDAICLLDLKKMQIFTVIGLFSLLICEEISFNWLYVLQW